ncbi:hypothetical protein FGIG_12485 [Fasciola gigantica]|uniref:Uncharacterized protein n=1 Tax=Fasciola gigantica TaxID=46835 RepID=A0A504Y958_FASGI|nr:hypothetical protein FGIG_12485 [Fasciola gigantica]
MGLSILPGSSCVVPFDPDSILVLTFSHLGKYPIVVNNTVHDKSSLSILLRLLHGSVGENGSVDERNYLRSQNYGLEYGLLYTDVLELASLMSALNSQPTLAVSCFLWDEDNVFLKYTQKWGSAPLPRLDALYLPQNGVS